MNEKNSELKAVTGAIASIVEALGPLPSDAQERVLSASRAAVGLEAASTGEAKRTKATAKPAEPSKESGDESLNASATAWMKRHGVNAANLENFLHIDGDGVAVLPVALSGKSNKEKCVQAYLLQGIAALVETGKAEFKDDVARDTCDQLGCYDSTNHAKVDFGKMITGTKKKGWKLTAPGLAAAADFVRDDSAVEEKS